ncbi:MAG: ABC transporter permease [Bacteroidales bacterium]|nr:ABC transporter permease [Bacteroidales bacterium]
MILKNIKHLLRQYPLSLVLNFIGLTCAFTAFLVISHQVDYELSFDTCHPTAERVFRVDKKDDNTLFRNVLPRAFCDDIIKSSPHIVSGCPFFPFFGENRFATVGDNPIGFTHRLDVVGADFITVFGVEMLEGDQTSFRQPNTVIIPKSLADALFPGQKAVGQMIKSEAEYVLAETNGQITVSGVYRDFPENTQINNSIYLSGEHFGEGEYHRANFICYLLFDDAENKEAAEQAFNSNFPFERFPQWLTPVEFVPLTSIYFLNEGNIYKSGSYTQLLLLIAIAVLILLIGMINFTNFYIALTPIRMRSVNTRLVFGASTTALRWEVIGESVVWSILSLTLALLLFNPLCSALSVSGLTPIQFSLGASPMMLLCAIAAAVATGFVAGILPGIYSTSVQPALALKGNFGLSKSGRVMRKALVFVQLIVSFALLIYVLSIERQSQFMKSFPCGFDKDNLAVVEIGTNNYNQHRNFLRQNLLQIPGVEGVAFASAMIGFSDSYSTSEIVFDQESVLASMIDCTPNFFEVMGIQVTEGTGFTETSHGKFIGTQNFKKIGAEVRKYEDYLDIQGFVNDLNITSLRQGESYVTFRAIADNYNWSLRSLYIRIADSADRASVNAGIQRVLKQMNPVQTYEVRYYDSIAGVLYSGEERLRKEIWIFSMIAIVLSLVGIWGQTLMDVKYRRKEIAVKRVMGASSAQIIAEGMSHYALMVGICFVVAAPLAYMASVRYLSQFARHTDISPMSFITSLVTVMIFTLAIVLYNYTMCVRTNPAEVLKHE